MGRCPEPDTEVRRHPSALGPLDWNATARDAVEGVRELKAEHDGDLVMSGCGELARELIQAGLVDELYF